MAGVMQQTTQKPDKLKRAGDKVGFGPLLVRALVFDLATGNEVARHNFDFNDLEKRIWFNEKLIVWAVHNKHSIELFLENDDAA